MKTQTSKSELTNAVLKMIIVAALFLVGFMLNYLESIQQ